MSEDKKETLNFLEQIIKDDLEKGVNDGRVLTRFPPEPNGYLHIGHSKSITVNFGLAKKFGGKTNLRFDDTNPVTEDVEYVEAIQNDIKWLGFEWDAIYFASDYFDKLYLFAEELILKGLAYVDDSTAEEIAIQKGTPTIPGTGNLFRNRAIDENLDLFRRMKAGEFKDGEKVLRAKVDMSSPNMLLRDPIIYRIKHAIHHRTGDKWVIYPMYDFAHGQSDSVEKITHSICTLEFESHRPLYNWFIDQLNIFPSKQYEFARLNINYTVMSKRKLLQLVNEGLVNGWDDPRMPTISGLRRRGYTAGSIREFANRVGVARRENIIDISLLEFCIREDLNKNAIRTMAVLDPIKCIIKDIPEGETIWLTTENNPEDPEAGMREIAFSRYIFIEKEDFMENPPPKYFRLSPGGIVRLKSACIVQCEDVVKNDLNEVIEVHCKIIPDSWSGKDSSGVKPQGTIHWLDEKHSENAEVRIYDRLFILEDPASEEDFKKSLNPNSLRVISNAKIEPSLSKAKSLSHFQFTRLGYFCVDLDSTSDFPIFNRTVTLKDTWVKGKK
jgi:glutaminyl-tRNA synthetase